MMGRVSAALLAGCLLASLTGLVFADDVEVAKNPDPWEEFNRKIHGFNDWADRWFLKPVAVGYTKVFPTPLRRSVSNFYDNLWLPLTIVNQLLQGKGGAAMNDTGRFLMNTTVGLAGLFDPATAAGLDYHEEDFGQTFGKWGVPSGPYLVLPLLGPSTVRHGVGRIGDALLFPPRYIEHDGWRYAAYGLWVIDTRSRLLGIEELVSGDRYLFIRDVYLQSVEFQIKDGEIDAEDDAFLNDDWDD